MRDAFMAIDAGLFAGEQELLMRGRCTGRLLSDVHRLRAMTIPALERVVRLKARPFMLGELEPPLGKFLARVDRTEEMAPDLFRGLHLARDLVRPVVRHVAVG